MMGPYLGNSFQSKAIEIPKKGQRAETEQEAPLVITTNRHFAVRDQSSSPRSTANFLNLIFLTLKIGETISFLGN